MASDRKENASGVDAWSQWIQSATDFWQQMAPMPPWTADFQQAAEKAAGNLGGQAEKGWRSAGNLFGMMAGGMADPTNFAALFNTSQVLQQMMSDAARQVFDSLNELQRQTVERAANLGRQSAAYSFEDLDLKIFDTWRDIYASEFGKFLNMPQLGLTRAYQENWARFADAAGQYQTAAAEFLYVFSVPLKKAAEVVQEQFQQDSETGKLPENGRELYANWIKVLEGHYMRLLQSPDYTRALNRLLTKLTGLRKAREQLLQDLLQDLPVATNSDMDALYKEHYNLKRRVRVLEKALARKERRD